MFKVVILLYGRTPGASELSRKYVWISLSFLVGRTWGASILLCDFLIMAFDVCLRLFCEGVVVTIIIPSCNIVLNIFGDIIAVVNSADDMVVVPALPFEFNVMLFGKECYRLFESSDNNA